MRLTFIFRHLGEQVPRGWHPTHWQVEAWPADLPPSYPFGLAWVTAGPYGPIMDFIMVPDIHRREGIATALVNACRERWPDLWLSDGFSFVGTALVKKLGKYPVRKEQADV